MVVGQEILILGSLPIRVVTSWSWIKSMLTTCGIRWRVVQRHPSLLIGWSNNNGSKVSLSRAFTQSLMICYTSRLLRITSRSVPRLRKVNGILSTWWRSIRVWKSSNGINCSMTHYLPRHILFSRKRPILSTKSFGKKMLEQIHLSMMIIFGVKDSGLRIIALKY